MYYFKNMFCVLVLCITVNAQDWPVGRVSEKDTISIWKKCVSGSKYDLVWKYTILQQNLYDNFARSNRSCQRNRSFDRLNPIVFSEWWSYTDSQDRFTTTQ